MHGMTPEISNIIHSNPRERLFVLPLRWTPLHLKLLNCSFQEVEDKEAISIQGAGGDVGDAGHDKPPLVDPQQEIDFAAEAELLAATPDYYGLKSLLSANGGPIEASQ
jgi:hypothetical protein